MYFSTFGMVKYVLVLRLVYTIVFYRLSHSDHESVTGTCVYLKIFEKQISEWMNIFSVKAHAISSWT